VTYEKIFSELESIVRTAFARDDLTLNQMTTAADVPGWNSFKMIEILLALEEHFSITMETWDLDTVHTVGDPAQRILDKVQSRTHQAS
jgi:acyl carrier protein